MGEPRSAAQHRPLRASVILLVGLCSCRTAGDPETVLEKYRSSIARKDARAILELSDATFRAAYDETSVGAALNDDVQSRAVDERLGRLERGSKANVEFLLEDGARVRFVREDGEWRISSGGLEPGAFDTPEHTLETFFRAVEAKRYPLVRTAVPKRYRDALESDKALNAHLEAMAERITRAREKIGPIAPGRAVIRDDRAVLTYGPGLSVTFESEDGSWRIVDVE